MIKLSTHCWEKIAINFMGFMKTLANLIKNRNKIQFFKLMIEVIPKLPYCALSFFYRVNKLLFLEQKKKKNDFLSRWKVLIFCNFSWKMKFVYREYDNDNNFRCCLLTFNRSSPSYVYVNYKKKKTAMFHTPNPQRSSAILSIRNFSTRSEPDDDLVKIRSVTLKSEICSRSPRFYGETPNLTI